jgi:hypothetical protein
LKFVLKANRADEILAQLRNLLDTLAGASADAIRAD